MDAVSNPYTPGSGMVPPDLAGRETALHTAGVAIERTRRRLPSKNLLVVGLRGVGKTVLLSRIDADAAAAGIHTVRLDAVGERSLAALLAPDLRLLLLGLSRDEKSKEAAVRALRALRGFAEALKGTYPDIEVGFDFESDSGLADCGLLREDLAALLESVGMAVASASTALVLLIDDLQLLPAAEWEALTNALLRCAQRELPILMVGAGLPQLRSGAPHMRSRVERLFEVVELGPLAADAATQALVKPAADLQVAFEEPALVHILATTQCHPYFLQELAKQAWDLAPRSPITLKDTWNAAHLALAALDEKFFRLRFDRLSTAERKYIRAMAELGPGPHRSGEIAEMLGRPVTALGPARGQLITKGMIWSPGHGDTAFTAPRFDEFLRRTWPGNSWRNQTR